jgi:hypothetical protein
MVFEVSASDTFSWLKMALKLPFLSTPNRIIGFPVTQYVKYDVVGKKKHEARLDVVVLPLDLT